MKRSKFISILFVLLVVSFLLPTDNVYAKVKINTSSATMYLGNTLQLKLLNNTNTVRWTSSNESVATVSHKGIVTAKSEGTTVITGIVSNRKYTCKITVEEEFSAAKAKAKLDLKYYNSNFGVTAIVTNHYKYSIAIDDTAVFYSSKGTMMDSSNATISCLNPGESYAYSMYGPQDDDHNWVTYSSYKTNMIISKPSAKGYSSQIKVKADIGSTNLVVEAQNTSNIKIYNILVSVVYFDSNEHVLFSCAEQIDCNTPKSTAYLNMDLPYDYETYDTIFPNSYKIYVQAFNY